MVAFVPRKVITYSVLMLLAVPTWAGLPIRNLNPFTQFVGFPELQPAHILQDRQQQFSLATTLNSHFVAEADETDPLYIDGESYVGDFVWRRGFADWEAMIVIPYVSYQKGFMDHFVDSWHNFFQLPDGGRSLVEDDQLLIGYSGKDNFLLDEPVQGVGDIRIQAAYQLVNEPAFKEALFVSLKLPTGNERKGIGSGGADLAIFSSWAWQQDNWKQELQVGVLGMQKPDVLSSMRRKVAVFGSAALGYVTDEGIGIYLQYDAHSRLYNKTDQAALKDGHMLSAGCKVIYPSWGWSFAVIEDIDVDSAPDVGFQLGIQFGTVR